LISHIQTNLYPLLETSNSKYQELIQSCREQLAATGCCVLPNFLTQKATEQIVSETNRILNSAFHNTVVGSAYLFPEDLSLPEDHPQRMKETTSLGAIAYDQIPKNHLLRQIYEWDPLMNFIAEALNKPQVYRYADPMGALNISVMKQKDYLRWHFDQTDFVVSIPLQQSELGGEFECVSRIRSDANENFSLVKEILMGSRQGVVTVKQEPGDLVFFEGRYSIHRVTSIEGQRDRLMALLGYDSNPGVNSTDHLRKMRYGRTVPYEQ
jgi:hypothetical protein